MRELEGKYAIITGASGGIGSATSYSFAFEGVKGIIIADIDEKGAEKVVKKINKETTCRCKFVQTDIGNIDSIKNLFKCSNDLFPNLDILVNGAGICNTLKIENINYQEWDNLMSINLRGQYICCKEAFNIMKLQKRGKIINISSISGRIGGLTTGIDYATSKGAKIAGPFNINVNAVAPGFIDTKMAKDFTHFDPEMVPLKRIGKPEEVADVITFLASEKSSYITGATIDINGGLYMS